MPTGTTVTLRPLDSPTFAMCIGTSRQARRTL
jgi:hypothetical protein